MEENKKNLSDYIYYSIPLGLLKLLIVISLICSCIGLFLVFAIFSGAKDSTCNTLLYCLCAGIGGYVTFATLHSVLKSSYR